MIFQIAKKIGIIKECSSCISANTGGHREPWLRKFCIVCGQTKDGPPGWVWSNWIVPLFIKRKFIARRINEYRKIYESKKVDS